MTTEEITEICEGDIVFWVTWIGESYGSIVACRVTEERRSGVLVKQQNGTYHFIRTSEIVRVEHQKR